MQPVTSYAGAHRCLLVVLMIIASLSANGVADDKMPSKIGTIEGVTEYALDNGLKILLIKDLSQPKVTVNCTVFVGARHEGYGEAGMAHLVEHMLFKGTELHPRIADALNDRGADFNGSTGQDQTRFYETLTASDDNLEFAIRLEADRLVNSKLLKEHLQSEASVVRSEFEMVESDPQIVLGQRIFSAAYLWHNYGKSVIGSKSDIEKVPSESLRAFYKKYYRPDNAMLIVAGNFDEAKAIALVQKYFGPIEKPKNPLPQTYTVEPAQDGDRTTIVRRVGDVQMVGAAYHIPAGSDPEFAAVQFLAFILTDQPSGRLYKSLVETKTATQTFGSAFGFHDPGALLFSAIVSNEKKVEDAQTIMIDTLERIAESPITVEEVDRARIQLLNYRETVASRTDRMAGALSDWAALGDWRLYFLNRDLIEKMVASRVQSVALKYLVRSNRTVGLFLPIEKSESSEIPERANVAKLVAGYQGREAVSEGEKFDPTPQNIEARIVRSELETGIPAAFLPKKTRGATVNMNLKLRFGDEKTLMGKSAAVSLLGSLMERGTKNLSLQQLNDRKDQLKAGLNVHSGLQTLNVNLETRRETLIDALDLIADILRNPALDEREFSILRDQVITNLESEKNDPKVLAAQAVARALNPYKRGDARYQPTIEEQLDDFKKLKLSDIKDIHAKYLSGTEGEVSVVGDFDVKEVEEKLSTMLSGWKSKIAYQRIAETATTDLKIALQSIETPDKVNSSYEASQQYAIRDDHPKYPALVLANNILGGGSLSSRLGNRVRQDEGLSYEVWSNFAASPIDERASLTISAKTNPLNRDKLVKAIDEEIRRFVKDGVTEKELKDNVLGFLQNQRLLRSRDGELASILANNLFTGRTMEYFEKLENEISKLTLADINETISEYVAPDRFVIATAGDFSKSSPAKPIPSKP